MSASQPVIVVVEDDPPLRRFLRTLLSAHGFRVFEADTGERGLIETGVRKPDLVILDLGLPDLDGVQVIERLRAWTSLPILILSARGAEQDKIAALDAGADDYLTKPFGSGELLARLRVALRHAAMNPEERSTVFASGKLKVDLVRRLVYLNDQEVRLTPIQYRLLVLLVKHAGKVLTHRQILREVWGPVHANDVHYLRIYMSQLRQKLEEDPARPQYLLTEPGIGYRLRA